MHTDWRVIAFQLGQLGFAIALCLIGGLLGGIWADRSLGTTPLFTLLGSLLGIGAASILAYRTIADAIAVVEEANRLAKEKKNQTNDNELNP
jgi:F0F1-type ATP synthase assembly protein I